MEVPKKFLIIPVHAAKVNWLYFFFESLLLHGGDWRRWDFLVVLAVSNASEQIVFRTMVSSLPCAEKVFTLCVEEYMAAAMPSETLHQRYVQNADRCIVNLKKMLALHWAQAAGAEWVACIDCDTLACADLTPLFSEMADNYGKGLYFALDRPAEWFRPAGQTLIRGINSACLSLFSEDDRAVILAATKQQSLGTFFFDVPVYAGADLAAFFAFMAASHGSLETFLGKLSWSAFAELVFTYWRLVVGKAQVIDYSDLGVTRIPDTLSPADVAAIYRAYDYCPSWIRLFYRIGEGKALKHLPAVRLLFHADRI